MPAASDSTEPRTCSADAACSAPPAARRATASSIVCACAEDARNPRLAAAAPASASPRVAARFPFVPMLRLPLFAMRGLLADDLRSVDQHQQTVARLRHCLHHSVRLLNDD